MLDVLVADGAYEPAASEAAQAVCHRKVLHVQSISSWAPSCIGPYSQVRGAWSAGTWEHGVLSPWAGTWLEPAWVVVCTRSIVYVSMYTNMCLLSMYACTHATRT